jgi:hypothetical protein
MSEDNEELDNFVRRLKKGTDGRYRGNIPLICFNCHGIGHVSYKCTHNKKKINHKCTEYSGRNPSEENFLKIGQDKGLRFA